MWRRSRVGLQQRHERATLDQFDKRPARLARDFAGLSSTELLDHFRNRQSPHFFAGFSDTHGDIAKLQQSLFPIQTEQLIESARRISVDHRWPLLGYGEKDFGHPIEWRRDFVSGEIWPLEFHGDVNLAREGADVRILWELNRLTHLITLGRAYIQTRDEQHAETFFSQLDSWREQNPVGRGPNWACAMEVSLRAMNLLAAFQLFRTSRGLTGARLMTILGVFDAHGAHIRRNLEYSYIATSNHYLSDVVGLLWLGIMLPELASAKRWREFGMREMLREMEVQILDDGADFESSTGYHRFVLELFLYSFILCRTNQIEIPERYWRTLHAMLMYVRAYLRLDGRAPLIGDTDSGQVLPITKRDADDHAYVLAIGASVLNDSLFKLDDSGTIPEELLWLTGSEGVRTYQELPVNRTDRKSKAFADAGAYVLRDKDLYLLFNASGCGAKGRGSHGHNDALSIEVAACGTPFIIDPGTYVYRSDLNERHLFRSTAYHSTLEVDGYEQNTTLVDLPFVIGNEAKPHVVAWETNDERDVVIAEHHGYARLDKPISHRRRIEFDKQHRYWLVEDKVFGSDEHIFKFRFHVAPGLVTSVGETGTVTISASQSGNRLLIVPLDEEWPVEIESRWTSRDYGAKIASVSICCSMRKHAPLIKRWALLPVCAGENDQARLDLVQHLRTK
jgi:hypothetical protein